jgi:PilZ domain-containing protein
MLAKLKEDRRETQRYRVSGLAKIRSNAGALPRDCWVSDVSDGGVRLHAEHVEVPAEFILVFPGMGNRPRECRVVWRLGCEIGAEFIDRRDAGFAQRMAGDAAR